MAQKTTPLKTFISYSWDGLSHSLWVYRLSNRLREHGVDTIFDQSDTIGGDSLADFMMRGIDEADKVIIICTENYLTKADKGEGGVGVESAIIKAAIATKFDTQKFIPVIRCKGSSDNLLPNFIKGRKFIDMRVDELYEEKFFELVLSLFDRPLFEKYPLGELKIPSPMISYASDSHVIWRGNIPIWR